MQENSTSHSTLIRANNISVGFVGRQVLQNVSLKIERGKIVTLIGPNGAGKTTLVRVILELIKPDAGEIWRSPGLTIGYMPQRLHIEPTLPISVMRFLQLTGIRNRDAIRALLERLKVAHLETQQLRNISGGELQRILLARALLRKPSLLILDEPAQGVDVNGQAELYQLIQTIAEQESCGILMISHDLHLVMSATNEVICLNQHVCCHGEPEHVSSDPAYLALFGKRGADNIAIYTHNHDHSHDIHGNVIEAPGDRHG